MDCFRINRKSFMLFILFFFITPFFFTNPSALQAAKPQAITSTKPDKELYNLHHGVIPALLFSDNGTLFFNDLFAGKTGSFLKIVEESVGKTYATGIKIVPAQYPDFDIVLISFPEPVYEPLNYHAALVRINGVFRYITLEKGNNISGSESQSFFCEWKADHTHMNYGPRNYDALTAFRAELITFLKK